MAENEDVKVDDVEDVGNDPEDIETTDWKAEALKARGIAKRNATRLEKLKKVAQTKVEDIKAPVKVEKKTEFDFAEKAFLRSYDIKPDEYGLVREIMDSTGKTLDEAVDAKYFQAELKERRDAQATKDAVPSASKRSTTSTRDTVDYWIAKGELPPADQRELRVKVVQTRIAAEKSKNQFADQAVMQ